ncbi:pseudopilin H [Gluconacetobacter takamatsuzukensis]|uniref:Pseudopilin H n=2 Tax=Gluconacetobacter takamatsuzukensis TaxID=1286190 RepID=A0A7W4PSU9_9PROT|nr:pseudopilin H [Gluconacetobacter takamatsuzukensis]
MIVVVLVLGVAGAILIARGPFHSAALDLRGTARQVSSAMREARMQAIHSGTTQLFTLDAAQRDYGLQQGPRHALPAGISVAGPARFAFYPDGSAAGPPTALAEGGRHVTLRVNWLTGATSVEGP